jgi:outer membrane protein assembly factor BamB
VTDRPPAAAPLLLALALGFAVSALRADWPQYLGPSRTGAIAEGFNASKWPANGLPAIRWQTRAGHGIASPIIVGGRVYTLGSLKSDALASDGIALSEMWTAEDLSRPLSATAPTHTQLARLLEGNPDFTTGRIRYYPVVTYAFAFDAATGRQLWATPISDLEAIYVGEGMNLPRATPLHHAGRLYFQTHAGAIACLDATDGSVLWRTHIRQLGSTRTPHFGKCGVGGAPFTDGDSVFLTFPLENNVSAVTAFDPATGAVRWQRRLFTGFRVDLLSAAHAVIENRPTIVVPGGTATYGLDPSDGSLRWTFDAHAQWPEISFDKTKHRPGNTVYWADQHPGRHPVIYGNYIVNRVFIWGGHRDQRTYCIAIENNRPRLIWDKTDLSAWRGLYIRQDHLLLAMDYNHFTSRAPIPEQRLSREPPLYDTPRYQCIDIPTGRRLWATDAFTAESDGRQLTYQHFEPEHIALGNQLIVMHMTRLGHATFDSSGIRVGTVATGKTFWGFSPLAYSNGMLLFQRFAAQTKDRDSFGDQEYNLFCLDLGR